VQSPRSHLGDHRASLLTVSPVSIPVAWGSTPFGTSATPRCSTPASGGGGGGFTETEARPPDRQGARWAERDASPGGSRLTSDCEFAAPTQTGSPQNLGGRRPDGMPQEACR